MKKEIYLAGGCFWGVEKYFSLIKGVLQTETGYANGRTENPVYEEVCHQNTGHAETVRVVYDNTLITLEKLLEMYYEVIDPTSLNRQGGDAGIQYRTGIYYTDAEDREVAEISLGDLQKKYQASVVVELEPLENFYPAESYHQKYLDKNPTGYCHIPEQAFHRAEKTGRKVYQRTEKEELKKKLNPLQYKVTQQNATEPPYNNEYNDHFERGLYVDITTGEPLFVSSDKYQSGCGWPAFSRPVDQASVREKADNSLFMRRTEVRSRVGDAHLGHVFDDGPAEKGGLRYCINSAALKFIPVEKMKEEGYEEYIHLIE